MRLHAPFSNALLGVGAFCLLLAAATEWLIGDTRHRPLGEDEAERVILALRFVQVLELFVGVAYIVVGSLRHAGHRWAMAATYAIMIPSLLLVPVGPIMVLWYLVWVRKRDKSPELL